MANSSSSNGQLAQHLADRALTPIISSANTPSSSSSNRSSQAQSEALSSLTSTAITVFEAASRLGLGIPQRIMVETLPGPIILHSILSPQSQSTRPSSQHTEQTNERGIIQQAREDLRALSVTTDSDSTLDGREGQSVSVNGVLNGENGEEDVITNPAIEGDDVEDILHKPPMLFVSVIASRPADLGDARRSAAQLERIGRGIQREWFREQEITHGSLGRLEDG